MYYTCLARTSVLVSCTDLSITNDNQFQVMIPPITTSQRIGVPRQPSMATKN